MHFLVDVIMCGQVCLLEEMHGSFEPQYSFSFVFRAGLPASLNRDSIETLSFYFGNACRRQNETDFTSSAKYATEV